MKWDETFCGLMMFQLRIAGHYMLWTMEIKKQKKHQSTSDLMKTFVINLTPDNDNSRTSQASKSEKRQQQAIQIEQYQ